MSVDSCGAPPQEPTTIDWQTKGQFVLAGEVRGANGPVQGAFVRLLDTDGNFVGEVVSSSSGDFRFYAAAGDWTIRALHRTGTAEVAIRVSEPRVHKATLLLA